MRCACLASALALLGIAFVAVACGLDVVVLTDPGTAGPPGDDAGSADARILAEGAQPGLGAFGVFAGEYATCGLAAGQASCWGSNAQGALGTGDRVDRPSPTPVAQSAVFQTLAPGETHACGIEASAGRVFCWGLGANGRLGTGDETSRLTPEVVPGIHGPAVRIAAGYQHTCVVTSDGSLWCWGNNEEGQLGQADAPSIPSFLRPVRVGVENDWLEVSGGQAHTCALRSPGSLWCWGRNTDAQLGLGKGQPGQFRAPTRVGTDEDWSVLDLGQDGACALRRDGSLWCWGAGGPAGAIVAYAPLRIGTDSDWTQVSTDVFTTCGRKKSGALYCWGRNTEGQLGTADNNDRAEPMQVGLDTSWAVVSVGRFHVCAESTAHVTSCTGKNEAGELGVGDGDRRNVLTPVAPLGPLPAH